MLVVTADVFLTLPLARSLWGNVPGTWREEFVNESNIEPEQRRVLGEEIPRRILLNNAAIEREVTQFVNDKCAFCDLETTSEAQKMR